MEKKRYFLGEKNICTTRLHQSNNISIVYLDVISTTPANSSIHNAMSTWQQVKQEGITIASPKSASIYFQTKPFVKASTKEGTVKVFVVKLGFYFIETHILKFVVYDVINYL